MLIKSKDVINLKVMSLNSGEFVENVKDIIYDPKTNEILGILISEGGWFSEAKVILFSDIHSIGKDALVISSEEVIKKASDVEDKVSEIAQNDTYLTATKIVTEQGEELGKVTDIYFDDTSGKVLEFEVSGGTVQDVKEGKKRVRISDILTVGKDATIVKSYTLESFEMQGEQGGIKGMVKDIKEKGGEIIGQVKDTVEQNALKAKLKAEEVKNDPKTQETLEGAKEKLQDVGESVKEKVNQVKEDAPGRVDETKQDLQQRVEDAKTNLNSKADDLKEGVTSKVMNDAAGQVLTKTIYNPNNNEVIGELGDEVDYSMLNKAKEAGVLEQVTQNVQKPLD